MKRYILLASMSLLPIATHAFNRRAVDLQDTIKVAQRQLDSITSILEYTGQIVNQGIYSNSEKQHTVRRWIFEQLTHAREIQERFATINEDNLHALVFHTRALLMHLFSTVAKDFTVLDSFTYPIVQHISSELSDEDAEQFFLKIQEYLEANQLLIKELEEKINGLGLSSTNRFCRYIDQINEDYQITKIVKNISRYVGFAALGLYLLPYDQVKSIPGIRWLKRCIGTSSILDPKGVKEIEQYPEKLTDYKGPKGTKSWSDFIKSDDRYTFTSLSAFAMLAYNQGLLNTYFEPVTNYLSDTWARLKGHRPDKTNNFIHPTITLDDPSLIGLESQIEQMREIVRYVTEPEKYDRSAAGLEKGILLTGPSGSGKTILIQATCGSINEVMQKKGTVHRFAVQQVDAHAIWAQVGGIKAIVKKAKEHAPCILWIDEIHNLMLQTKEGGNTLSEFLTIQDELRAHGLGDTVILIAATNRPYALDDALLKPGRFGLQIHFENPTFTQRKKFFFEQCKKNAFDAQALDCDGLARQMDGCSYGELKMIFNKARFTAMQQGRGIRKEDFQRAIEQDMYRLRDEKELPLPPEARTLIAAHQAGRAFMQVYYESDLNEHLELVTLKGRWNKIVEKRLYLDSAFINDHHEKKISYGHLFTSQNSEMIPMGVDPMIRAKAQIGGLIAEEVLLGVRSHAYRKEDMHTALKELEKITLKGLPESDYTLDELIAPKQEAKKLLEICIEEVRELLTRNKEALMQMARELNTETLLRGDTIKKIVENHMK